MSPTLNCKPKNIGHYKSTILWLSSLIQRVLSSKVQLSMTIFHLRKRNEIRFKVWDTSHTRLRARDHCTSSSLVGGKADPVQVCFTLRSMWMQDGCKVYMSSYMASSNGSCFMFTWTIFKNHHLEACLTQNRKTMAFWTLITVDWFYFIMCEDLAWI